MMEEKEREEGTGIFSAARAASLESRPRARLAGAAA